MVADRASTQCLEPVYGLLLGIDLRFEGLLLLDIGAIGVEAGSS